MTTNRMVRNAQTSLRRGRGVRLHPLAREQVHPYREKGRGHLPRPTTDSGEASGLSGIRRVQPARVQRLSRPLD